MPPVDNSITFVEWLADFKETAQRFKQQSDSIIRTQSVFKFKMPEEANTKASTKTSNFYSNRPQGKLNNVEDTGPDISSEVAPVEDDDVESNTCIAYVAKTFDSRAKVQDVHGKVVVKSSTNTAHLACHKLLFDGACTSDNCTFSHDTAVLNAACEEKLNQLTHSKYNVKGTRLANMFSEPEPTVDTLSVGLCSELLSIINNRPPSTIHSVAHVLLNQGGLFDIHVLNDTGAVHSSYISEACVAAIREKDPSAVTSITNTVRRAVQLADAKTTVAIKDTVEILLSLGGTTAKIQLDVIPMKEQIIVGLPQLSTTYSEHFLALAKRLVNEGTTATARTPAVISTLHCIAMINDTHIVSTAAETSDSAVSPSNLGYYPVKPRFPHPEEDTGVKSPVDSKYIAIIPLEIAPEESIVDVPCAFSEFMYISNTEHTERVKEYHEQLSTHLSPDFLKYKPIVDIMNSPTALQVFVPKEWTGLNRDHIDPIHIDFDDKLPARHKPKARFVNPRIMATAEAEYQRMLTYMFVRCDSPLCSPQVIAPKETKPFVRLCGDYSWLNKHIVHGHHPIPQPMREIHRFGSTKYYLDLDLTNAFHQFPVDEESSHKLSVQTMWGQVRPLFIPEGIACASSILQQLMDIIFHDMKDFAIVIYDNILLGADSLSNAAYKLKLVIDRCHKFKIILKLGKSHIGFKEAKFFGYIMKANGEYELGPDRKDAIMNIPFPTTCKMMQSFMGAALFFKSFVPHYSVKAAYLYDTIKKGCDLSKPDSWPRDYRADFEIFKTALVNSIALHHPDYMLEWVMSTDASDLGCSVIVRQVPIGATTKYDWQVIFLLSHKWSGPATRWDIIQKELYPMVYGTKHLLYYLRGKPFTMETDHANIVHLVSSDVPKLVRWRVHMQSFAATYMHVPGVLNKLADAMSRLFHLAQLFHLCFVEETQIDTIILIEELLSVVTTTTQMDDEDARVIAGLPRSRQELLQSVHGGTKPHFGSRRTWMLLNNEYPGHRIPFRIVSDYISECPVCQKTRLDMREVVSPITRVLKPDNQYSLIGSDYLTITKSRNGNTGLHVIINLFTHTNALLSQSSRLSLQQCILI
jgi:hypothetical protein